MSVWGIGFVGFIFITFLIGALNLFIGYAVAVRLGYGPSSLTAPLYADQHAETPATVADDEFESMLQDMMQTDTDDMLDEEDEFDMDLEPAEEPYDEEVAALTAPDTPEVWDLNEKYVETSILRLNIAMIKSGARSTEIDTRLRAIRGNTDQETIKDCWTKLKEDCESYLTEQSEAAERFSARISELGDLASLGEEIEFANMNQASQIETTVSNLVHMDFDSDLEVANARLLEEIANLRNARHQLRDDQESAFLMIARYEDRMDKIEEKLYHDALTAVRNRVGLEVAMHEWWNQRRHEKRAISAVMFDLDDFDLRNEEHGCLAGDQVLYHFAQLLVEHMGASDMAGRFSGQRFLLLTVDSGPRAAIKTAETIRQATEKLVFLRGAARFSISTSGGITEVSPDDETYLEVIERLEKSITAAKQGGRNCIFSCQRNELDAEPERIEAPSFGIDEREIEI